MATIERRERQSGTVYLADVRIRGFPRQKKTFKRLTDAKIWAQQTEAAIRQGEFRNVLKTAKSKTLRDVIAHYRTDVRKSGCRIRGELSLSLYTPQRLRRRCVFEPSCSHCSELAIREHGLRRGVSMTINRLRRCRMDGGGVDYPSSNPEK